MVLANGGDHFEKVWKMCFFGYWLVVCVFGWLTFECRAGG